MGQVLPLGKPRLADKSPEIRWNAARTLGKIGAAAKETVPSLVAALKDDDALVRATAAAAVAPLDSARVAVTIEPAQNAPPRSSAPRGSLVRVELRYVVPLPLGFAGLPRLVVLGKAVRRIEWSP